MVPPARLELAARGLGNRCSIPLSYGGGVPKKAVTESGVNPDRIDPPIDGLAGALSFRRFSSQHPSDSTAGVPSRRYIGIREPVSPLGDSARSNTAGNIRPPPCMMGALPFDIAQDRRLLAPSTYP